MKPSTFLSFFALGATALARPLYQDSNVNLARRQATPTSTDSATPTATDSATATSSTDSASTTSAPSSSATPTETFLYSTITNTGSLSYSTYTQTQPESTNTVSTSTSTEYPQSTNGVVENVQNVQVTEIIHVFETIKVREVVVVQQPVFVAVQVNVFVRQQIFINQFQSIFQSRFNQWDPNVVEQLALVISQQYDVLIRASNSGFQGFNNDNFNAFVGKFMEQFGVFQSIQLVDVQQFVTVVQGFSINQLGSFFGRSDALFSQAIFTQFSVNNDFSIFVQQLSPMIDAISSSAFNTDGLFQLNDSLLVSGLSLSSF